MGEPVDSVGSLTCRRETKKGTFLILAEHPLHPTRDQRGEPRAGERDVRPPISTARCRFNFPSAFSPFRREAMHAEKKLTIRIYFVSLSMLAIIYVFGCLETQAQSKEKIPEMVLVSEQMMVGNRVFFGLVIALTGLKEGFFVHMENRPFLTGTKMPEKIGTLWTPWPDKGGIGFGVFQARETKYLWSEKAESLKKRGLIGKLFGDRERKIYFDNATRQTVDISVNNQKLPTLPPQSHGEFILTENQEYNIRVRVSEQMQLIDTRTVFLPVHHKWKGSKLVKEMAAVSFYIYNVKGENTYQIRSATYLPKERK